MSFEAMRKDVRSRQVSRNFSIASAIQRKINEAREKEMQAAKAKRAGTVSTDAKRVLILTEKTVRIESLGNQHRLIDFQIFVVRGHRGYKE